MVEDKHPVAPDEMSNSFEELLQVKPRRVVFITALGILDISETHKRVLMEINNLIAKWNKRDDLSIRVSRDETRATSERINVRVTGDMDFQFDANDRLFGVQFGDVSDIGLAFDLIKEYARLMTDLHRDYCSTANIDTITVGIQHVFHLNKDHGENIDIVQEKLVTALSPSAQGGLFSDCLSASSKIGRVDTKVSFNFDEERILFVTVECPANENNSTIWPDFNFRTHEDFKTVLNPEVDTVTYIEEFVEEARRAFFGPYAKFLIKLLGDAHVDLSRRE